MKIIQKILLVLLIAMTVFVVMPQNVFADALGAINQVSPTEVDNNISSNLYCIRNFLFK